MINRYTAVPADISIVDRPCCPTAKLHGVHKQFEMTTPTFELRKRDGTSARIALGGIAALAMTVAANASAREHLRAMRVG